MTSKDRDQASSQFIKTDGGKTKSNSIEVPSISLPKGGGAIKGIDEKFAVNATNGTSSFSIPLPFSPARGSSPSLSLSYNSGAGNGIFGLGWNLSLGSIKRKTDKGLPQYFDSVESDTFLFSDAEDLVPEFQKNNEGRFLQDAHGEYVFNERLSSDGDFIIRTYRPRIEGLFARIERWSEKANGRIKWRVITNENSTTLFGWTDNSIISHPDDPSKIYEWLPEFVFDDKGNCHHFFYKKEDAIGFDESSLHNRNRHKGGRIVYTNLYLEKVLYGNKTPYKQLPDAFPNEEDYFFQTVFDYGILSAVDSAEIVNTWDFRPDAFSDYKAGFEIRTTRLCRRVLLFHVFDELALREDLSDKKTLIQSINFDYDTSIEQDFTFLKAATSFGYIKKSDGTYAHKKLPPLEFEYQKHHWSEEVKTISPDALIHAPAGFDDQQIQFTDLFNEGLSGILTEQANGWYYKHNIGDGKFEQAKLISPKPSFGGLGGQMQLLDLDADGGKQLVSFQEPSGYFELDDDNEWQRLRSFKTLPNIDFGDTNTRMLDLNGDGMPEVVISEDTVFTWYASEGKNGFAQARRTVKPLDDEAGPHIVFSDPKQRIYLADMSGDGMTDILRIRNGEVCYWPNLGYGKFGAKVTMDSSPVFDHPDIFNPAYLRLADLDGSGTSDIVYLSKTKFACWKNLSGNRFSITPFEINPFPEIHSQATITVADLLGNGVACIVWSSPLTKDTQAPLKYIDLMSGKKPHVMVSYKNNLGKEVSLEYTPSTKFYIDDKLTGKPWVTKLPFPVHCVSRTITEDKISGYKFVSEYKYHHGYYDHAEKEFRGFGMVEQTDAETFEHWTKSGASNITDATLHQEPVVSRSWHHTGAFLQKDKILNQFAKDYWYEEMKRLGFMVNHHEADLPDARLVAAPGIDSTLIEQLSSHEWREVLRACKGMTLRSETFARDAVKFGSTPESIKKELTPFSVATQNCVIELLQPKGRNKHAVFVVKESEAISYSYERNPDDPRITHSLNVKLDEYGNVLESASVVYPRLIDDGSLPEETREAQHKTVIVYTKNQFSNDVFGDNTHRLRLPSEIKTYELKGVSKAGTYYALSDFIEILSDANSDTVLYYELNKPLGAGKAQKRLIEHIRSIYYRDDLVAPLPLHQIESMAFPFENYQLAYTPELLADIYSAKASNSELASLMDAGKFCHSIDGIGNHDNDWWIRSGTIQFRTPAESLTDVDNRFYVPISYTDPYGATSSIKYYKDYFLFVDETEDAIGNKTHVEAFNFRTLSPAKMRDINGNFSEVICDELGLVKAVAIMGKGNEADELTGFSEITDAAESALVRSFLLAADSNELTAIGKNLLNRASSRFVYDLDVYTTSGKPIVVASITREQHSQQLTNSPVQMAFEYSNGLGEVIMTKGQAEPGIAKLIVVDSDNNYTLSTLDTSSISPKQLRWLGNGRTVKNNKGNAVKQYEPYFSATWRYEDYKELVETGVTPIMYYDAAGRLIKTEMPDGTFSRVEFDSWKQKIFDANDTILEQSNTWYSERISGGLGDNERQAAEKAARHSNTPNVLHFDTLGRPVLSIDHNKNLLDADEFYRTKTDLDVEGNLRSVTDARELPANAMKGNTVMQYKYDMLGNMVYQSSMDAGQRWLLMNIIGKPLRIWDERDSEFLYEYDQLHRPTKSVVINTVGKPGDELLNNVFDRIVYGESLLLPNRSNEAALQGRNILGKVIQHYDTGGRVDMPDYDFKGQPKITTRKLFKNYKEVVNWTDSNLNDSLLEADEFTFSTHTDALGRITQQTAPDGSIIIPAYNEAGLLESESVLHPGSTAASVYIKEIDYNEKGQRNFIRYGNGVRTTFEYDSQTMRLSALRSNHNTKVLQDLRYTYDAVGNITFIKDDAHDPDFFSNRITEPTNEYTYDAIYRLIKATGRENDAALHFGGSDNWNDAPFMRPNPIAIKKYAQTYHYDAVGNIDSMTHRCPGNDWSRNYVYNELNNRLVSTAVGDIAVHQNYTNYPHHALHGFITAMPHLQEMGWNFKEELVKTIKQKVNPGNGTAETTYYQYDGEGQRIRKITENSAGAGATPTKKEERIYLAGYELYKKYANPHAGLERVSLSLMDDGHRFVMIETRNDINDDTEKQLVRYQLHNHLGSASLELDDAARIISYEEYHPFGTTAFQAKNENIKAAAKRYRYTGMERDEETGLEYHSARYYLPWLGRWLSADPIGIDGGIDLYVYSRNAPLRLIDLSGKAPKDPEQIALEQAKTTLHKLEGEISNLERHSMNLAKEIENAADRFVAGRDFLLNLIETNERDGGLSRDVSSQRKHVESIEKKMKDLITEQQGVYNKIEDLERQAGQQRAYVEDLHDLDAETNKKIDEHEKRLDGKGGKGGSGSGGTGGSEGGGGGGGGGGGKARPQKRWWGKMPPVSDLAGAAVGIFFGVLQINNGLKEKNAAVKLGSAGGGAMVVAGELTSLLGSALKNPAIRSIGGKLAAGGNVVLAPVTAYRAWNDISSGDSVRQLTGSVDLASLAAPEFGLLSAYIHLFAPPAAEKATQIFSSATSRDMGEITGYSGAAWFW